jgi:hypothetical protein
VTASQAQYKKASFLAKRGISMELTGRASFISKSSCVQPAVAFSVGREKNESRYFNWHDFEFLLPANYTYTTNVYNYNTGEADKPVEVQAKAKLGFQYRFNSGIFLVNNADEEKKLLPFVNFGAGFLFHSGSEENPIITPAQNYYDLEQYPSSGAVYGSLNAGIGLIYKITPVIGVKATGGYNVGFNFSDLDYADSGSSGNYSFYESHPYVTLGFRFLIRRGGE